MTISATRPRLLRLARSRPALLLGLLVCAGALALAMASSIAFGAADVAPADVWGALFANNPLSSEHAIIRTLRVPRSVAAALVGAALGVAGALMQGLTRNPLADPGILGIETGAALGVVTAVYFLDVSSLRLYALFAFAGAALTAGAVFGLGALGRAGPTPLRITLAGAALTGLLASWTTGILLFNQRTLQEVRFWLAGSVAGRELGLLAQAAPYLALGLGLALALGRQITTLALGDDLARGLGQRTGWAKLLTAVAAVVLAGTAVAISGPIGFVGLVVPHAVRFLVGVDYRWILPYSALAGALFVVCADMAARLVLHPLELPLGAMTALIGGPLFVYLVRWRVKR